MAHTYICFDADNDMWSYQNMRGWKANGNIPFDFDNAHELNNLRDGSSEDTIKRKLRARMAQSDMLIILIGDSTRHLFKYVRYEIEIALEREMAIVACYLNGSKKMDRSLCPPIIRDQLVLHIPYKQAGIKWAMNNWRSNYTKLKAQGISNARVLSPEVYRDLGI